MSEPKTTVLPDECCAACKFYLMREGLCRRYPPTPVGNKTKRVKGDMLLEDYGSYFPSMAPIGYCGEFKRILQ